jgi:hypothetical protein
MEKLSNKNVDLKYISNIFLLNIPQNFNKPLKVAMWWANPQEVHLKFHSWGRWQQNKADFKARPLTSEVLKHV